MVVAKPTSDIILYSRERQIWPAGRHISLEQYSDFVLLQWPPLCKEEIDGLVVKTCLLKNDCFTDKLELFETNSETTTILRSLQPCSPYLIRLFKHEFHIWTFNKVWTLPKFENKIIPQFDEIQINIRLQKCGLESIYFQYWLIEICEVRIKESSEEFGSGISDDEDILYDVSEELHIPADNCPQVVREIITPSMWITFKRLTQCTLYAITIEPRMSQLMHSRDTFRSIYSTLCNTSENSVVSQGT